MDKEIDSKDNSTDAIAEDPPPSIRSLLGQFCGYTTAHGLGRLSESKNIISRLTWSLFCVGASTMFVLQVYNLFLIYLSRPVSTVVKVEHESVSIYVYQFKQACTLTELDLEPTFHQYQTSLRKNTVSDQLFKIEERNSL